MSVPARVHPNAQPGLSHDIVYSIAAFNHADFESSESADLLLSDVAAFAPSSVCHWHHTEDMEQGLFGSVSPTSITAIMQGPKHRPPSRKLMPIGCDGDDANHHELSAPSSVPSRPCSSSPCRASPAPRSRQPSASLGRATRGCRRKKSSKPYFSMTAVRQIDNDRLKHAQSLRVIPEGATLAIDDATGQFTSMVDAKRECDGDFFSLEVPAGGSWLGVNHGADGQHATTEAATTACLPSSSRSSTGEEEGRVEDEIARLCLIVEEKDAAPFCAIESHHVSAFTPAAGCVGRRPFRPQPMKASSRLRESSEGAFF